MGRFNWGIDGPPQEAYSRVTEPERFAPLGVEADRLIAELASRFGIEPVTLDANPALVRRRAFDRIVRLEPREGSPLTFAFQGHYLTLLFGWWQESVIPPCSCDACDEDAESAIAMMRQTVGRIVERGFTEELSRSRFDVPFRDAPDLPPEFRRTLLERTMDRRKRWILRLRGDAGNGSASEVESRVGDLIEIHEPGVVSWPAWG